MIELYLLAIIITIPVLLFVKKRIWKTDAIVVHNTYNYGDNIGTQVKDSVVQRSFNSETKIDSSGVAVSVENIGKNMSLSNNTSFERKLEYTEVYNYLLDIARNGCKNKPNLINAESTSFRRRLREQKTIVTYGDVLTRFGKIANYPPHQNELYPILDEINESTKPVLLSALVVNGDSFLPSKPFFSKWVKGMESYSEQEQIDVWKRELNQIWNYYCNKR